MAVNVSVALPLLSPFSGPRPLHWSMPRVSGASLCLKRAAGANQVRISRRLGSLPAPKWARLPSKDQRMCLAARGGKKSGFDMGTRAHTRKGVSGSIGSGRVTTHRSGKQIERAHEGSPVLCFGFTALPQRSTHRCVL